MSYSMTEGLLLMGFSTNSMIISDKRCGTCRHYRKYTKDEFAEVVRQNPSLNPRDYDKLTSRDRCGIDLIVRDRNDYCRKYEDKRLNAE